MDVSLQRLLKQISVDDGLVQLNHGIEKEALRITRDGYLSRRPHPPKLGAALTHSSITTDFSESQLEFVTRVHTDIDDCLQELDDIHRFVYGIIERERLWPASMPCMLQGNSSIPIAQYGESNAGKIKSIYRTGLAHRYGRYMQSISGLHYNFSIPDSLWQAYAESQGVPDSTHFRNMGYMNLIRNFQRFAWLPIYLFGASPAVCGSFISTANHGLEELDGESFYLPYATSLRMGPLGYQSSAQVAHYISFNSLPDYVAGMHRALTKNYEHYEKIGLKTPEGQYKQLSTALLQIEAEAYGTIRPKPRAHSGPRPLEALNNNGIEYLEVRCLDLNPFYRTGISGVTARFLDAMLLYSWLLPSPQDSSQVWREIQDNQLAVVRDGRNPSATLQSDGSRRGFRDWALEILSGVKAVCECMDACSGTSSYAASLEMQMDKVLDQNKTPSAQILAHMTENKLSYYRLIDSLANKHQFEYLENPLSSRRVADFEKLTRESLSQQIEIEEAESQSFDEYLQSYMQLDLAK